jgi:hypothetical protein
VNISKIASALGKRGRGKRKKMTKEAKTRARFKAWKTRREMVKP